MQKVRTFESFPVHDICPVCRTNNDGECVLVGIDGTGDGNIVEAIPVHLVCAVATNYNRSVGILYRRASN
jgi:hypothetical protein